MESPRKFNDCYFYYYSTCTKGDNCVFRHEPSALGCETMCTAWQQGKCIDKKCKLRHMELRKNRKQIQCYWENQPGGCRKKHCPFMHKNPDARTDGIAPSQPAPPMPHPQQVNNVPEGMPPANLVQEQPPMPTGVAPVPAPVPLLWQQQRQVVLDSAILGVLPASSDLLPGRRVLPTHAHAHDAPNPYAPMPVDPLVVNFEEESDNESAPSSTPTKNDSPDHSNKISRSKSQELLLLERIQAESAAYYSYDGLPPAEPPKERKIVRTNLSTKYDRLSLDELAGKTQTTERRSSLDFKVLSLDEIRARKKINEPAVNVNNKPIVLNLNSRKRKLSSTQETITTSGNKMIKVVRSNSVVYKKVDQNATAVAQPTPVEPKPIEDTTSRKRTISEQNDMLYGDMQDDELVDNCFEFKRIKLLEPTTKPRLIRNTNKETNLKDTNLEVDDVQSDLINKLDDNDSDPEEVQIVSVELNDSLEDLVSDEVILVGAKNDPVVVDLSDDETDIITEIDLDKNVPDVVASCQKNSASDNSEIIFNGIIDSLLESDDDL